MPDQAALLIQILAGVVRILKLGLRRAPAGIELSVLATHALAGGSYVVYDPTWWTGVRDAPQSGPLNQPVRG